MKIIKAINGKEYKIGNSIQTEIEKVRDNTFWNTERF